MNSSKATSWLLLSEGYMYSAVVLSKECNAMIVDSITQPRSTLSMRLVPALFVAIYNARHGIELYLKCLIVVQCDSIEKYKTHDLSSLLAFLSKGDERLTPLRSVTLRLDGVEFPSDISQLESLVEKYAKYAFHSLPSIVDAQLFAKIDKMNMYFRFPDNEPTNAAIYDQFEDLLSAGSSGYVERNIGSLHSLQRLTEEIERDMESLMNITQSIGNTIAAHVNATKAAQ